MGVTTIGGGPGDFASHSNALIQTKPSWGYAWQNAPDLQFVSCDFHVCEAGVSKCEFRTYYGPGVKLPHETEISPRDPADLLGHFVRVVMDDADTGQRSTIFSGKVFDEPRMLRGNSVDPMGSQEWQAYGPVMALQRISISRSFWVEKDGGDTKEIGWLPSLNVRGKQKMLVGNRSAFTLDGFDEVYGYGGKEKWTYGQYLRYVLFNFVQQPNGPEWRLGGQVEILEELTASIEWSRTETAYDILRKLIPREYGLGWAVTYTERGYEITVYSLLGTDTVFGETTISRNPNTVRIQRADQLDLIEVNIVRSEEQKVDSFRVIGSRVVMCATLAGENAEVENAGELTENWTDELEEDYIAGAGVPANDFTIKEHTKARALERFKNVYCSFIAPLDWDYREGKLAPLIGLDGTIQDEPADFQNTVRSTQNWLPVLDGFDYTVDPPVDNNVDGNGDAAPSAPLAWIYNGDVEATGDDVSAGFQSVHKLGMSLSVLPHELGFVVRANPNHTLALGHSFGEDSPEIDTTESEPLYDYQTLVATIAWETDQRIQLGFDAPNELKAGDGSRKDIFVDNAEMWVLAARTVLDISDDGNSVLDSGPDLRIIRNDTARLAFIAAGVKARYIEERVRAHAVLKGFKPWIDMVGQILELVEEGGGALFDRVGAPISSMRWSESGKHPVMEFFTGYAGGA